MHVSKKIKRKRKAAGRSISKQTHLLPGRSVWPPRRKRNFPQPLYKLGKVCYNTSAIEICASGSMDRASDSGSEGWGFESLLAYQRRIIRTCSLWETGSDYLFSWVNLRKHIAETVLPSNRNPSRESRGKRSRFRRLVCN